MPVRDDDGLRRFLGFEMAKLTESLVTSPKPLAELLKDPRPQATTRGGQPYPFNGLVLREFAARLSPLALAAVRVPITFYIDHETRGDCYLADPAAIRAVQETAKVSREPRAGRLWMSEPLARRLADEYATLFQFAHR